MKHISLVLSILFWAIASLALAVKLPSTSYSSYSREVTSTESFTIGTGAAFNNISLFNSNTDPIGLECGAAVEEGEDYDDCAQCCQDRVGEGNTGYGDCMTSCKGWALGEERTPLGEVLILLPFITIYAVVRKRKENTEQA